MSLLFNNSTRRINLNTMDTDSRHLQLCAFLFHIKVVRYVHLMHLYTVTQYVGLYRRGQVINIDPFICCRCRCTFAPYFTPIKSIWGNYKIIGANRAGYIKSIHLQNVLLQAIVCIQKNYSWTNSLTAGSRYWC